MSGIHQSTDLNDLRELWSQWTSVVERIARRRKIRRAVSPGEYRALHDTMMIACRKQRADGSGPWQQLAEQMVRLGEPWVTLEALKSSNQRILLDLLDRCREVDAEMNGKRLPLLHSRRFVGSALLMVALILAVALLYFAPVGETSLSPATAEIGSMFKRLMFRIRWSSFIERFSVVTVIVVVVAILLGTRSDRRWS